MHGAMIKKKGDSFRYSFKSYTINPFEHGSTVAQGEYQYKTRHEPTSLSEDLANFKLRSNGNLHYYYYYYYYYYYLLLQLPNCPSSMSL